MTSLRANQRGLNSEGQPEGSEGQLEGSEGQPEGSESQPEGFEAQLEGSKGQTGEGQTDGRTDKLMDGISPHSIGLRLLPGPMPKNLTDDRRTDRRIDGRM